MSLFINVSFKFEIFCFTYNNENVICVTNANIKHHFSIDGILTNFQLSLSSFLIKS